MKILLTTINVNYIHPNIAIRLLYQLNKEYEGLSYKDFYIKNNLSEIAHYCAEFDVVALSCYIWNITKTLQLASEIKKLNPNCKIMLGGPEVSYEWAKLMNNPDIDYLMLGEGEIPFSAFLKHYPNVEKVPSLVWKSGNEIVENREADFFDINQLANINPYEFDDISELKNRILYIESSRGCPFTCSFCLAGLDNKLRFLPMETVKKNLLFLMENGRIIKFLDRTFNAKRKFAIEVFQFILEHHRPQNIFQFEIKADILHPEIIDFVLKNVPPGLFRFEVGIQTISNKANEAAKRKQDFDKVKQIILQLSQKIEFHLDLIVGLPYDYWDDIKYSVDEVFKFHASEIQLGFLKFLKGTSNRNMAAEHEYVYDELAPYQIKKSKYLTENELYKLHLIEHVLGVYWNKKRAVRSFTYISEKMSIFEFMFELALFAENKVDFHKYTLINIFDVLWDFVNTQYTSDPILIQLVAIDFYMLHKVKPGVRYIQEIDKSERNTIIETHKLNHHKYRFMILPISFDYQEHTQLNQILIIQYTGTQKPQIIKTMAL